MRQPGLGWRTRVQFAVRPDGLAGLRAHRSHEVVDIGDCPIAHPAIRDLGLLDYVLGGRGHGRGRRRQRRAGRPGHRTASVILTKAGRGRRGAAGRPAPSPGTGAARDERGRDSPVRSEDRAVELFPQEAVDAVEAEAVLIRTAHRLTPLRGRQYLAQFAAGRHWQVSAGGFWQVHPAAADTLSEAVLGALEPKPGDTALDLYCGAGLFAGVLAPLVGAGRLGHRDRVGRGRGQGRPGQPRRLPLGARCTGTTWRWRSPTRGLPQARLVVADPPRAGLAREVVDYLTGDERRRAERFAYVSCDPATLARDLGLLIAGGWRLDGLRAFDAFPMTHHVECVVTLTR